MCILKNGSMSAPGWYVCGCVCTCVSGKCQLKRGLKKENHVSRFAPVSNQTSTLQGSVQRGEALHQQGHGPAVCREDRRCGQLHLQPRPEHRR